jgi:transposase
MNQNYFIGIDISKEKLDCAVIFSDFSVVLECIVPNNIKKIKTFLKSFCKKKKIQCDDLVICCESTGIYNEPLRKVCTELNIGLWEEHALRIKRASMDMRGKSDRKDAMRIAEYLVRYGDRAVWFKKPSEALVILDRLDKVRETLLTQKLALQNQLMEAKSFDPEAFEVFSKHYNQMIKLTESQIKKVELEVQQVINQNENIQQNIQLMKSVPGVGNQTALQIMLSTENFTKFKSAKQLACYAGVVPFQNESGTITKRARVSKMACRKLKTVLHMAALCAIRTKSELKDYFIRKVAQGKNKMSVLNAIRNKIILRIWAVIERKTSFLPNEIFRPI